MRTSPLQRGDLFRVPLTSDLDPRRHRVFCVVSREPLLRTRYSTVICAPIYTTRGGLNTEVPVGEADGLLRPSSIRCDELTSVERTLLRDWVGRLSDSKMQEVDRALAFALDIEHLFR